MSVVTLRIPDEKHLRLKQLIRHAAWPCSISWTRTLPVERQRLSAYQFPAPLITADWPLARSGC
jgi:hypothetical protein